MESAQQTLYLVQTLCWVIGKSTTLQQIVQSHCQISLSLHVATVCNISPHQPLRKVREKRFYCISIFYTVLMGTICKTHARGIATAHPTWALRAIYIRFSCWSSCRHVKCLLLLYCHCFHSTYTCCWASGLVLKRMGESWFFFRTLVFFPLFPGLPLWPALVARESNLGVSKKKKRSHGKDCFSCKQSKKQKKKKKKQKQVFSIPR